MPECDSTPQQLQQAPQPAVEQVAVVSEPEVAVEVEAPQVEGQPAVGAEHVEVQME
jgi:hypothetical protein